MLASDPEGEAGLRAGTFSDLGRSSEQPVRVANKALGKPGSREAVAEGWLDIPGFLSKQLSEMPW